MPYITLPERNEVPKTNIYYEIESSDPDCDIKTSLQPSMIMLPGGPGGNLNTYDLVRKDLSKYADLILLDPRGCGESDESEAQYCTIDHHIDDIEALRNVLGIKNPIILGGSYGAMTALGYAIKYPNNLSKLICIAGSAHFDPDLALRYLKKFNSTNEQIFWAQKLFTGEINNKEERETYYKTLLPLYIISQSGLKNFTLLSPKRNTRDVTHIFKFAYQKNGFVMTFDWRNDLHKIKVPTRLIFGDLDWITPSEIGQKIKESITSGGGQAELIIIEKCGHFQWLDQYGKFIKSVTEFIDN